MINCYSAKSGDICGALCYKLTLCRAGHGNNVIKQLPKGTSLNLTGKVDGAWKEVSLGGDKTGWVNGSYVEENVSVEVGDKKKE